MKDEQIHYVRLKSLWGATYADKNKRRNFGDDTGSPTLTAANHESVCKIRAILNETMALDLVKKPDEFALRSFARAADISFPVDSKSYREALHGGPGDASIEMAKFYYAIVRDLRGNI